MNFHVCNFFVEQEKYDYQIVCSCGETPLSEVISEYEVATTVAMTTVNTCEDEYCAAWPVRISAIDDETFVLNVSNFNAAALLEALGALEDDSNLCGSLSGEDFLGRVLLAEAIMPHDEGMPAFTEGAMVYCGREEGYLGEKLMVLRQIGAQARSEGLKVVWS